MSRKLELQRQLLEAESQLEQALLNGTDSEVAMLEFKLMDLQLEWETNYV